jgi:hypothetical protein
MAKPNYNFEKRQRELAKKKKKDEKLRRKQEHAATPPGATETSEPVASNTEKEE